MKLERIPETILQDLIDKYKKLLEEQEINFDFQLKIKGSAIFSLEGEDMRLTDLIFDDQDMERYLCDLYERRTTYGFEMTNTLSKLNKNFASQWEKIQQKVYDFNQEVENTAKLYQIDINNLWWYIEDYI